MSSIEVSELFHQMISSPVNRTAFTGIPKIRKGISPLLHRRAEYPDCHVSSLIICVVIEKVFLGTGRILPWQRSFFFKTDFIQDCIKVLLEGLISDCSIAETGINI